MSEFKLCENGHYYPQGLKECPYCPKTSQDATQGGGGGLSKTKIADEQKPVLGGGNLNRTQIFTGSNETNFGGIASSTPQFKAQQGSTGRKLVGWLVSFTIDPNGADFKLYEGRNLIGSDPMCDIAVVDAAVSSKHLTILHRMGHFKFKDELSTNGTFINDVFEEEGNLKDGDIIRIGDTIFKFRSIA